MSSKNSYVKQYTDNTLDSRTTRQEFIDKSELKVTNMPFLCISNNIFVD